MATDNQPDAELQKLAEPVQFDDADIVLQACGVDFRVHKLILSHASSVFKDMFSLPRNCSTLQEGIPIVEVTEDAQTMHDVLSLIYLNTHGVDLDELSTLQRVLLAPRKYSMDNLHSMIGEILRSHANSDPIHVFVVACITNHPEIAHLAAKEILKFDYMHIINAPEIHRVRASALCKLLRYHHACGERASKTIDQRTILCPVARHNDPYIRQSGNLMVDCRELWWDGYIDHIKQQVKFIPLQADFNSVGLIRRFSDATKYFSACKMTAFQNLVELGEQLRMQVQEAIAVVQLGLDDDDFLS
ncbi:hypothetical protein QCA50_004165 [Cerrena zonata]|uniref:BTB domain-containing protein n=1 Tax=Cerrena zonata TaxID=2478898 RepID=A0AAW0GGZ3_9APHY